MELILIFLGMIIILILNAYQIQILKDEIKEIKQTESKKPKQFKREHSNISKTNFGSILNGRTDAYAKYKNSDGLYEPVRTKNGIEIKKREV